MMPMTRLLVFGGLVAAAALPASASQYPASDALALTVFEQRKDVEEIAVPQPPSGPATPIPFCSPGAPICP